MVRPPGGGFAVGAAVDAGRGSAGFEVTAGRLGRGGRPAIGPATAVALDDAVGGEDESTGVPLSSTSATAVALGFAGASTSVVFAGAAAVEGGAVFSALGPSLVVGELVAAALLGSE